MKRMMEFLKETSGAFSSVRLVMLLWSIGILVVWAWLSIANNQFVPLDWTHAVALTGISFAKAMQKGVE